MCLVGRLPVPFQLLAAAYGHEALIGADVQPSTSGCSLLVQQRCESSNDSIQTSVLATCSVLVASAALASNDSVAADDSSLSSGAISPAPSMQCQACSALALAPADIILTAAAAAAPGESRSCGTLAEFQPRCRSTLKHLHLLLQQRRLQLQVVSTAAMSAQQQVEVHQLILSAAPSKQKGKVAARMPNTAAEGSASSEADGRYCWAMVSIKLLPRFLFDPATAASSTVLVRQQQQQRQEQQQQAGPGVPECHWSLPSDQLVFPPDTVAAAINCVIDMLQQQEQLLQHHERLRALVQQQQLGTLTDSYAASAVNAPPAAAAAAAAGRHDSLPHVSDSDVSDTNAASSDSDGDSDWGQVVADQQGNKQQNGQVAGNRQHQEQLDLLCCPDTAAAAAADVRQSMFDFVDSQPWQLEERDPPGLACQLYRYQRRALAWMIWREQQQQSTASRPDVAQAARGVLGTQLLNPLWVKVVLRVPGMAMPQQAAAAGADGERCTAAAAAAAAAAGGCGTAEEQQWQHLELYHAPSHGLVSLQQPAAYVGPAGGMLCDEMGIGKTVEVFSLILARPPPAHILGKRAAGLDQPHGRDDADISDHDLASDDSYDDCPLFERPDVAAAKRRRKAAANKDMSQHQETAGEQAAADGHSDRGSMSGTSWPAPGKWAGATLVVTPPAILQQWVSEASKRTSGLKVEVYDGLKWQRAQAEAATRKEAGRQSRGARAAAAAVAAWQYIVDGPPNEPVFDAAAEASAAVAQLLDADVVITTYDVLQQEVYFSGGNSERLSSLRHKKRYQVPQSPLLQVDWWRLVFDEAQQVGPLSNTAVMAGYLKAQHRWVVTGTPIGAGGLADVGNLLRLINASPFDEAPVFRSAIERPFYESVEAAAAALSTAGAARPGSTSAPAADSDDEALPAGEVDSLGAEGDCMLVDGAEGGLQAAGAAGGAAEAAETPAAAAAAGDQVPVLTALAQVLAPRYRRRERDGVRRLLALLQPLMWRTSKAVADLDHPLPPRHLQCAYLRFSPAEKSFYDHILDKTAAAKQEMEQQQSGAAAAAGAASSAAAAAGSSLQAAAAAADGGTPGPAKAGWRRGRGRRKGSKGKGPAQDLQQLAADQIAQLRRACVHPQLTSYWKELSNELQLQRGGALSISEILGRMRDAAQLKLQAAERELCSLLNARASILMAQADAAVVAAAAARQPGSGKKGGKKRRRSASSAAGAAAGDGDAAGEGADAAAAAGAGDADEADVEWQPVDSSSKQRDPGGSSSQQHRPKKRVRFAAAAAAAAAAAGDGAAEENEGEGADGAAAAGAAAAAAGSQGSRRRGSNDGEGDGSPEGLRGAAWKLLEDSWAVAQHGIRAILPGSTQQDLEEPLGDISGGDATWKAWKLVELHTAQLAATLAHSRNEAGEASTWDGKVAKKQEELLETPMLEEAKARTKLDKHLSKVQDYELQLEAAWREAAAAGVPLQDMTDAASAAAWLSTLSKRLSEAKALEQSNRQQITQENGPAVLTTVLNTQHVPQVLDTLEGSAAADRALSEGVVGGQYVQQMLAQLHKLEAAFNAAAAAGADMQAAGKAGAGRTGRAAAAASAGRKRVRFAASAAAGEEGDTTEEEEFEPQDSEDDAHAEEAQRAHTPQTSKQQAQHSQQAQKLYSAAIASWASSSNLQAQQYRQQQERLLQPVSGAPTGMRDSAPASVDPAAAAQAATYQFLDCLPERRVLWRLLLKGSAGAAPLQDLQQQQQQQLQASGPHQGPGLLGAGTDPLASAGALGGLVSLYAATAFASSPHAPTGGGGSSSGIAGTGAAGSINGPAAAAGGGASTALQSLQSFQSRLLSSKGASLLRQVSRQLHKKREGYVRTVGAAIASADAAASSLAVRAAEASAAAASAAAQGGEGAEESAAAAQAAAAAAAAHVNVPRLLQGLPVAAVAAAAEAARLRVELCRMHKDVHQAELRLEVALHNKQLAQEEATAAAAGQAPQALAFADKSLSELARAAADATKKCDELARHKRFLDNQAIESRAFADAAKRKKAAAAAAATAAAAESAGGELALVDDEEGEVECAVCRSPMSEELQVFGCGHYYCDDCAQQALSAPKPTCPYCRKAITRNGVFRVSLGGSGGLHEPEVDPPEGQAVKDIKVTGSWMTKIEALLRRLLLMRANDPTAKALVFSQYPDALALISKALNVVQMEHVSLGVSSGRQAVREAIKKFTENDEVCVFLLSLRAGSAGLTLTAATRVYLLEPAMDPAIEQQAVARVHRIGQEKEVVITRLLVADTVEEEVLKTSETKQALLVQKEAAHSRHQHLGSRHHHRHHHQHHKGKANKGFNLQQEGAQDAEVDPAGGQLEAAEHRGLFTSSPSGNKAAAAAAAAAAGKDTLPSPRQQQHPGLTLPSSKRRRNSNTGGSSAGPVNAATAPPLRKEPVGREEAVGLLQAVMKQRKGP